MADPKRLEFTQFMGVVGNRSVPAGSSELVLAPQERHLNHNGDVAGPVLFGLAEFAGMGAAVSGLMDVFDQLYVVIRDARITYPARARREAGPFTGRGHIDAELYASARADALAGKDVDLEIPVRITDAEGLLCAEAEFRGVIRPRRR